MCFRFFEWTLYNELVLAVDMAKAAEMDLNRQQSIYQGFKVAC